MSEPIDGVSRSGIPYRRGSGPNLLGGLTVAWDVLPGCPACGKPTGEKCFMVIGDKECAKITPHKERLPEVDVVGDALEPDEEAATANASALADPGEGHRTGTGGPDAPGASEGLDAAAHSGPASPAETDMLAALLRAEAAVRAALDAEGIELTWDDIGKAVRAAEPILRQAVAEQIARAIDERNAQESAVSQDYDCPGGHECPFGNDLSEAAEIAREVGRGQ